MRSTQRMQDPLRATDFPFRGNPLSSHSRVKQFTRSPSPRHFVPCCGGGIPLRATDFPFRGNPFSSHSRVKQFTRSPSLRHFVPGCGGGIPLRATDFPFRGNPFSSHSRVKQFTRSPSLRHFVPGCGGGIRTHDLLVMSQTSCQTALPRYICVCRQKRQCGRSKIRTWDLVIISDAL